MKRQVVGFDDSGFWVSSGYAPLRVAWREVIGIYTKVYRFPNVGADAWRVLGIECEGHDSRYGEDGLRGAHPLELHADTSGLADFRAEVYRRFSVSADEQTRLETSEQPHRLALRGREAFTTRSLESSLEPRA